MVANKISVEPFKLHQGYTLICVLCALCFCFPAFAINDKNLASYAGVLDRMGTGIAELGMGNVGTVRTEGGALSYWNPALLAFQRRTSIGLGEDIRSLNRNGGYAYIQGRPAPNLGLGLSVLNRGDYDILVRDADENVLGTARPQDIAVFLGFGFKTSRKNSFGGAVQWFQANRDIGSSIGDINLIGIVNLGWVRIWNKNLTTGISLRNLSFNRDLSANYEFNSLPGETAADLDQTGRDFLPKSFAAGIKYSFYPMDKQLDTYFEFLDYQLEDIFFDIDRDHHAMAFRTGTEWHWSKAIKGRAGYDRGNISFGLGYRWRVIRKKYLEIDYAILIERNVYGINPFGLGIKYYL